MKNVECGHGDEHGKKHQRWMSLTATPVAAAAAAGGGEKKKKNKLKKKKLNKHCYHSPHADFYPYAAA